MEDREIKKRRYLFHSVRRESCDLPASSNWFLVGFIRLQLGG